MSALVAFWLGGAVGFLAAALCIIAAGEAMDRD